MVTLFHTCDEELGGGARDGLRGTEPEAVVAAPINGGNRAGSRRSEGARETPG